MAANTTNQNMSSDSCQDDFKLIHYKRGTKSSRYKIASKPLEPQPPLNTEATLKRIKDAKSEITSSDLFASALASLREALTNLSNPPIHEIICFGLGRIGECMISRYQLGFLLCLKDLYKIGVKIYDPVFTETDICLLKSLNCEILNENFEGKYKIENNKTTIFYLPHCPKQLSNNLLWANWGLNLTSCIIIANSFNTVVENSPKRTLNQTQYIVNILPHVLELPVINSFRFYEIFNDTAIHIFPSVKIRLLSDDFWSIRTEPSYPDDDIEFIRKELQCCQLSK